MSLREFWEWITIGTAKYRARGEWNCVVAETKFAIRYLITGKRAWQ